MGINKILKTLSAAMVAVIVLAGGAFAADSDTAYVPFVVNVDATVTAVSGVDTVSMTVTGGVEGTLKLPLGGNVSVLNPNGTRGQLNAPAITRSRGNISLRLPAQSYKNAEISLYSVNGKRILRGNAAASEAVNGVSRRNVAAGVYLLSVKGINGSAFTTRLTHSGGKLNINVGFGGQSVSPDRRLGKKADAVAGDWEITVEAAEEGYEDYTYTLNTTAWLSNPVTQEITLERKNTFVDSRDGKVYKKVTIGTQTWMAENLNYGGVCYDYSADNCAKYGSLYTWSAAMTACPVDWHLPSDAEWTALVNYVDRNDWRKEAGEELKSTSGWDYKNGTDEYGFSALPGGYGFPVATVFGFNYAGYHGFWWTATEYIEPEAGPVSAWRRRMSSVDDSVSRQLVLKQLFMFSVRCVQDDILPSHTITFDANGGTVTPDSDTTGGGWKLASLPTPTREGYVFNGWFTAATGGTQVTTATVFSGNATVYAQWALGFTDSRDGKTYKKVVIGTQTWMGQNLNYRNSTGSSDTVGVCYDNSADNCAKYGRLYNWSTAMNGEVSSSFSPSGVQGACPVGWHLPSDAEWDILVNYAGGESTAGEKLKSAAGGWHQVGNGTDDFGFSALLGGYAYKGGFQHNGLSGYWWSATESDASYAWERRMDSDSWVVRRIMYGDKNEEYSSVRCVQDVELTPSTITFDANGGTVTPTFGTTGTNGILASLPTPTRDDGKFIGWFTAKTGGTAVTTRTTFTASATIYAQWVVVGQFTDARDDKTYNKVTIGVQTWMAENLNYAGEVGGEIGKCYGNSADSCAKYGRLYNWSTAKDVCPVGWHLPSDAEWDILVNYAGGESTAGKKLKSTAGWASNGNDTDDFWFSALPGGYGYGGNFYDAGFGYWWSATEHDAGHAYYRRMSFIFEDVDRSYDDKALQFSVRCVQD